METDKRNLYWKEYERVFKGEKERTIFFKKGFDFMANQSNLKPQAHKLTVEEQSKGGKKSGAVRNFKTALKRYITENPNDVTEIVESLFEAAKNNDLKALQIIIELSGESIKDKEIAARKEETKVKQKHYESTDY